MEYPNSGVSPCTDKLALASQGLGSRLVITELDSASKARIPAGTEFAW
jgi:hypothetical protein